MPCMYSTFSCCTHIFYVDQSIENILYKLEEKISTLNWELRHVKKVQKMDYLRISYENPYGHGPKVLYLKDIFK